MNKFFVLLLFLFISFLAKAQSYSSKQSGDWNTTATWNGGIIPSTTITNTGNNINVSITDKITLNSSISVAASNSYTIGTSNGASLVISGDVIIYGTGTLNIDGDVTIHGNLILAGDGSSINIKNNHTLQVDNNLTINGDITNDGTINIGGNLTETNLSAKINNKGKFQIKNDASISGFYNAYDGSVTAIGGKLNLSYATANITNGNTTLTVTGDVKMDHSTLSGSDSKWLFLSNFTADPSSTVNPPTNGNAFMAVAGNFSGNIGNYGQSGNNSYNLYVGGTTTINNVDHPCVFYGTTTHTYSGCNIGNWADFLKENPSYKNNYLPDNPGTISGPATVCTNAGSITYSISPVNYATSYTWTLPSGATGTSTSNSIMVSFSSFTGGTLSVIGVNAQGSSAKASSLAIGIYAVTVPAISGTSSVCQGNSYTYTTESGKTNYSWTVSGGGTITAGGTSTDNSVTIKWNATGAQSVAVNYTDANGCSSSTATSSVTVNSSYTPSVSVDYSPKNACQGTNITFKATPVNGGTTPSYQWYLNGNPMVTTQTYSVTPTANDVIKCVMTANGICTLPGTNPASAQLTHTVYYNAIVLGTVSPTTLCAGTSVSVPITIPCDFPSDNIYTVQLSDAAGSFTTPVAIGNLSSYAAGSYTINCTIPVSTATGTGYKIRVISNHTDYYLSGMSDPSAALNISATTGTVIDPSTYGTSAWNVFCYNGNNYTTFSNNSYVGYYTENNLSFDSRTRWSSGASPATANASSGLAYQGCASMSATNIALSFKRTNIPCGYYQIDIPYHDDSYELYIDGAKVASHYGCCDSHTNVWSGWINTSTKIEFRLFQGGGGSGLQATFTTLNPLSVTPTSTIVCSGTPVTLTASGGGTGVSYSWSSSSVPSNLNTTAGSTVTATPTTTTTYTVTATDASSHCIASANSVITVASSFTLGLTASPTTTVCGGVNSTTLTATGASTYTWSSTPAGFSATGSSVTVSPTSSVTYTVTGSIGSCAASGSKSITITGMNPVGASTIDTASYGDGTWNALCYASPDFTSYYGFYTENKLNFNTADRWGTSTPSSATISGSNGTAGIAYNGCSITGGSKWSLRFKRTNISCGYYTLNVNYTDDGYSFWIDGKKVASSGYTTSPQNNVWSGFIGPNSKLELRLSNSGGGPGQLDISLVPTTPNTLSPAATICAGTSTTMSTSTITGGLYTWSAADPANSSWLSTTSGASTVVTPPSVTAQGTYNFICTITDATGTGCSVSQTLPLYVNPNPNTAVTPTITKVYCPSANITLTASGANTYTWTSFPAGFSGSGATVTVSPTVTTTYTVTGNNNCYTLPASSTITVDPLPENVSTFPTDRWGAYVYNTTTSTASPATAPANYTGYYSFTNSTAGDYSFNTSTQYNSTSGPSTASTSTTSGYSGCSIGGTNYTVVYKRSGFTCGYYQIDINSQDDKLLLYVNGTSVAVSSVYTTTPQLNVWSGYLDNSSTIELRLTNNTGPGALNVSIKQKAPTVSITSDPATAAMCDGTTIGVNLTASAPGTGNTYAWTPTSNLSSPSTATTNARPSSTTTYTVSVYNCGSTLMATKDITVTVLSPSVISVDPTPETICEYTGTSFTITSSNTTGFQWQVSSDNGNNWTDLSSNSIYSGVTNQTLSLSSVPYALNNMLYRCKTTVCSTVFSNSAALTVKQAPTITLGTFYPACLGNASFNLPYTVTGSPVTYSLSGFTTISNASLTPSPLSIAIPTSLTTGSYPSTITVTDGNGCSSYPPLNFTFKLNHVTPGPVYKKNNQ
jgi:hypothetical protein